MPAPDQIEPLIGYRSWRVYLDMFGRPSLSSCFRLWEWSPVKPVEAECLRIAAPQGMIPTLKAVMGATPKEYQPATHKTKPPELDCACGIYAHDKPPGEQAVGGGFYGVKSAPAWSDESCPTFPGRSLESYGYIGPGFFVRGTVQGWGRFIEGTQGWRTEFAKVAGFLNQPFRSEDEELALDVLDSLAQRFQVPLLRSFE